MIWRNCSHTHKIHNTTEPKLRAKCAILATWFSIQKPLWNQKDTSSDPYLEYLHYIPNQMLLLDILCMHIMYSHQYGNYELDANHSLNCLFRHLGHSDHAPAHWMLNAWLTQ